MPVHRNHGAPRRMKDPMELTVEHIAQWRERMDTIGSSQSKGGRRKTFCLNANGVYLVREHHPATTLEIYRGTEAAEAVHAYNDL
jgi:hypothetical protein